jgi:hypothetical protein
MPASSTPLKLWFTYFGAGRRVDDRTNIIPRISGNFLTAAAFSRTA